MKRFFKSLLGIILVSTPFHAHAAPLVTGGTLVNGYGSSAPIGTVGSDGFYAFDIPINGTTDLFFRFDLGSVDLSRAEILFEFRDLDLPGANTPAYLTEQVQFFTQNGRLTEVIDDINYVGLNEGIANANVVAAGNTSYQLIGISGLEDMLNSLGVNDIIVRASFSSFSSQNVGGAPEFIKASLYSQEVPEPASMLLLGSGLVGLARMRKRKLAEA